MADNKIQNSIDAVRKGLKEILSDMEVIDKKIIATAANAQKIGQGFKANTPDGLTQILTQQNDLLQKMNGLLNTQNTNTEKLNQSRKTLKQLSSEEVVNQRKLAKNADLQAQATSKLVGAYDRLNAKFRQSKQNLNDLNASQSATRKEVRAAEREFKKYQDRLNQVNRATSNFSKNSLGGMVNGFRNLLGAFGLVGGVTLMASLVKDIFNLIKQLESLEYALTTVTESASELGAVQEFLIDISNRYGVNLVTTTERFTKFLAAAKQSSLGLEETRRIFESVTKASAVLGLRTDELTGVYLALEQMLSKGKVTTEELRRQLGERLPGAFGIMAQALGVSVAELDKMLKKGEVLSSDALPKFAVALEKAYGIEAVNTVDTLAAAQGRLQTAWISFVNSINTSEGTLTKIFKSLLEDVQLMLQDLEDFIKTAAELSKEEIDAAQTKAFNDALARAETFANQYGESQKNITTKLLENLIKSAEKNRKQIIDNINAVLDPDGDRLLRADLNKETKKVIQEQRKLVAAYTGEIDAYTQKLAELGRENIGQVEDEEKKIKALKGSIAFLEEYIKKLEEKQQKLATNTEAFRSYTQQIEKAKGELIKLKHELDNLKVEDFSISVGFQELKGGLEGALKEISQSRKEFADEQSDALLGNLDKKNKAEAAAYRRHLDAMQNITETVFDTFSDLYDLDIQNFEFLYDKKTNKLHEWANVSKDIIGSVLDASLNRYDIELQEAQRARDLIVNNELASEKEKRIANEKFEEEERRIKTKRAKQERTNTLIKIAVDTAAGIAAAFAPPPIGVGPLAAPGYIPIIAGIGAAQAALVASQPLPKFAEGTKAPLPNDTLAWVGDGGRKEAITKDGKLLDISPDRPTLAMLPKGAEVHKDASDWINNAIYRMNMSHEGEILSDFMVDKALLAEVSMMRKENKKLSESINKLSKRQPIFKPNIKVELPSQYKI